MFLLYLDDSGSAENANEETLVLGGICVFERQAHYFTQRLDDIAGRINPADPASVEFHASTIFSGREPPWYAHVNTSLLLIQILAVAIVTWFISQAFKPKS